MLRLLFLAILAIGFFTQLPMLTQKLMASLEGSGGQAQSAHGPSPKNQQLKSKVRSVSGKAVLQANGSGHYFTKAFLNGKPIKVVIDTGASYVALSYEDARRVGIRPSKSDFKVPMSTANGKVMYARAKLRTVRIGQAEERNIEAVIAPKGALNITLMGMSYLQKLKTFRVDKGQLLLES